MQIPTNLVLCTDYLHTLLHVLYTTRLILNYVLYMQQNDLQYVESNSGKQLRHGGCLFLTEED